MEDWKWQGPERFDPERDELLPEKPKSSWTAKRRALFTSKPGRLSNGVVAMGAAAIVSVYAIGYAGTSSAHEPATDPSGSEISAAAVATSTTAATSTTVPATSTTARGNKATTSTATTPATATATTAAAASTYADGTYSGTGTSKHGNITVSVVIAGGKITSTSITQCGTHYPCSRISSLPGQVVTKQSAKVSYVSGATDSSSAFSKAVAAALAQAVA